MTIVYYTTIYIIYYVDIPIRYCKVIHKINLYINIKTTINHY